MKETAMLSWGGAALALLAMSGCGSSTRLASVWSDPTFTTNSLNHLMVISVGKDVTIRRVFEDRFTAALRAKGAGAQPSYPLFSENVLDSASVSMKMHEDHCDGVFVTRVVDQKTLKTYYPPTSGYIRSTAPYYSGWYGYYSSGFTYVTTPGYTVENQVVSLETNLYRVSDSKLVWSALSTTWVGQSDTPGAEIDPSVHQLVEGLLRSGIIARRKG